MGTYVSNSTPGAMTFSRMTLSIMNLIVTLSLNDRQNIDTRHNQGVSLCRVSHYAECRCAECRLAECLRADFFMLSAVAH
jgi:hypothetical protein